MSVNFSPMSPKLLITHIHRQEDRGFDLEPLFLWFVLLKLLSNQLKALSDFLTVLFVFVYFEFCWLQQKRTDILVLKVAKMWIFKVHHLLSNKFDTKINAILVISELMASVGKVLQWWKYFVCTWSLRQMFCGSHIKIWNLANHMISPIDSAFWCFLFTFFMWFARFQILKCEP